MEPCSKGEVGVYPTLHRHDGRHRYYIYFVARMIIYGKVTLFRPPGISAGYMPRQLVAGFDGNVWLLQQQYENASETWITKVTLNNKFTPYSLGSTASPSGISAGPNQGLWFGYGSFPAVVGSISMSGKLAYYKIKHKPEFGLAMLASQPKGPLWILGRSQDSTHPYFLSHISP